MKPILCLPLLAGTLAALLLSGCPTSQPLTEVQRPVTDTAVAPPVRNIADVTEIDLVEKMAQARKAYTAYLDALIDYYRRSGDRKLEQAEKERADLKKIRQYVYLLPTDLPPAGVTRPTDSIAEANDLFQDGWNYYKHFRLPGFYSKEKMRLALDKFNQLIQKFPQSDKVDDALFYAAEILKEFLGENEQAVEYYRRAYEADPNTPHPAHFQRAVILDFRLHQRERALAEYQDVLKYETGPQYPGTNQDFAARRIRQLMEGP